MYADGDVQLQLIDRRKFDQYNYISDDEDDEYDASDDEVVGDRRRAPKIKPIPLPKITKNWNDIPDDFLITSPLAAQKKTSPETSRERKPKPKPNQEWDEWEQDG